MGVAPWGVVRNREALTNPKVGARVFTERDLGRGLLGLRKEGSGHDSWVMGCYGGWAGVCPLA